MSYKKEKKEFNENSKNWFLNGMRNSVEIKLCVLKY